MRSHDTVCGKQELENRSKLGLSQTGQIKLLVDRDDDVCEDQAVRHAYPLIKEDEPVFLNNEPSFNFLGGKDRDESENHIHVPDIKISVGLLNVLNVLIDKSNDVVLKMLHGDHGL